MQCPQSINALNNFFIDTVIRHCLSNDNLLAIRHLCSTNSYQYQFSLLTFCTSYVLLSAASSRFKYGIHCRVHNPAPRNISPATWILP